MSSKFQTTQSPEQQTDNLNERMAAQNLSLAFAIVGKMIAERWLDVNFQEVEWADRLRNQVQSVAEVLHDLR